MNVTHCASFVCFVKLTVLRELFWLISLSQLHFFGNLIETVM